MQSTFAVGPWPPPPPPEFDSRSSPCSSRNRNVTVTSRRRRLRRFSRAVFDDIFLKNENYVRLFVKAVGNAHHRPTRFSCSPRQLYRVNDKKKKKIQKKQRIRRFRKVRFHWFVHEYYCFQRRRFFRHLNLKPDASIGQFEVEYCFYKKNLCD